MPANGLETVLASDASDAGIGLRKGWFALHLVASWAARNTPLKAAILCALLLPFAASGIAQKLHAVGARGSLGAPHARVQLVNDVEIVFAPSAPLPVDVKLSVGRSIDELVTRRTFAQQKFTRHLLPYLTRCCLLADDGRFGLIEGDTIGLKLRAKPRQLLPAGQELKRDCAGCTPRLRRQSDLPHLYPELGREGLSDGEISAASRYFNLG